jgi:hypothetical protein
MLAGFLAAWHLAGIDVKDLTTFKMYKFICGQWLSATKGDKKCERELTCLANDVNDNGKPVNNRGEIIKTNV